MKSLWRIFIVLTLALLGMQVASACEHHHDASPPVMNMHTNAAHCAMSTNPRDSDSSCHRSHSLCCMSACGVHCGALLSNVGMATRVASLDVPGAGSDPARAGVTRAPPVRPPIA